MHDEFLTVAGLKDRGWTDSLIRKFLGGADSTRPNPHYRNSAPMRLYAIARVVAAEPLMAMRDEWVAANAVVAAEPAEDDADAANWARVAAIETRILTAEPRTLLGALIQIETWAVMAKDGVPDFAIEIAAGVVEQVPGRIEGLLAGEARS